MGTLNLCQKMPDKMQKDLGDFKHSIQRKRPKTGKLVNFDHILDIFSKLCVLNDLILFASYQASSDTSLEYPHGILW